MRILMSIHHDLDANAGAPGVTYRLARALRRRGHDVEILSFERMRAPKRLKGYLYPWFVASYVAGHPRYDVLDLSSGDGWMLGLLSEALARNPACAIFARSHGLEHVAHEARLRAARSGAQRLSWKYPIYHGGFRLWECRMSFAHANAALFLNDEDLRYAVTRFGLDPARAVRIRNGIDDCFVERAERLRRFESPAAVPKNVAFVGRYTYMKGSAVLREAMTSILERYPDSRLGLFGTMLERDAVLADFPKSLRARIAVTPSYANGDLPRLVAEYQIFAFPSLSEGFSIAPLEAMACGLVPVVAATPGPLSYVASGKNGIVVPVGDAASLESAIAALLDDPAHWNALREECLATALDFSWDAIASETERLYERFAR